VSLPLTTTRNTSAGPSQLRVEVDVAAPVERTWTAAVDWNRQHEWMLATRVRATAGGGHRVGGKLAATTGIGRLAFVDEMEITGWDPPHGAYVKHLGRVVRGTAAFEVRPRPGGATFIWTEDLDLPLGAAGRVGFRLARPLIAYGLRLSLRRFAAWAPDYVGVGG
jgi:uncharacterized protein YndB with AHSA1/START domain